MINTVIVGSGHYIPQRFVSLDELAREKFYDKKGNQVLFDLEKKRVSIGVDTRPYARDDEYDSDMAAKALENCLETTEVNREDITDVIVAHNTGDKGQIIPSIGSRVCKKLGLRHAISPDFTYGCQGALGLLHYVDPFIRAGKTKYFALIAVDKLSDLKGKTPSGPLFSDGAAVLLLAPRKSDTRTGILETLVYADNDLNDAIKIFERPGFGPELDMDGPEVYKAASKYMAELYFTLLDNAGLRDDDIAKLLLHQASGKIVLSVARNICVTLFPELRKNYLKENDFDKDVVLPYMQRKVPETVSIMGNNSLVTTLLMFDILMKQDTRHFSERYAFHDHMEKLLREIGHHKINPNDKIVFDSAGAGMGVALAVAQMDTIYWEMMRT